MRTCATSSPPTRRAASGSPPRAPASTSTTRRTASRTRRSACSVELAEESGLAERTEAMFRGERINIDREPLRPPRRAAHAAGRSLVVDGVDVVAEVHEVARPHGRVLRAHPLGRVEGSHGQADPQRRQRRDRRLRPRAGHGLRGAPPLHAPRPDLPLRLERRLDRLRRGDARPRARTRRSSSSPRRRSRRSRR